MTEESGPIVLMNRQNRVKLIAILAVAGFVAVWVLPPLRQPQSYHHFADERTLLGVPNFFNVVSNGAYLVFGVWGLVFLSRRSDLDVRGGFISPGEKWPYAVFFVGVLLTCFGSGYYHWKPSDATLVWDRLPMTLGFMSMLAATIAERISVRAGVRLLCPLLLAGMVSVWWWQRTGNLWPYAATQYLSLLLIVLMLALFPPRYTRGCDLAYATGFYVLGKIAEALDAQIYQALGFMSGHSLKHLITALAPFWILRMLWQRGPAVQS